jgi:hypothetical protein
MRDRSAYCRAFVTEAKRLFEGLPGIEHIWVIEPDESSCTLTVPCSDPAGFEICFEIDPDEWFLRCGGFHADEAYDAGDTPEEFAGHAVGFLYDLLSPLMRVRERLSGGSPYKWTLECRRGESWENRGTVALLLYKYWGKRSERICSNRTLPQRENPLAG